MSSTTLGIEKKACFYIGQNRKAHKLNTLHKEWDPSRVETHLFQYCFQERPLNMVIHLIHMEFYSKLTNCLSLACFWSLRLWNVSWATKADWSSQINVGIYERFKVFTKHLNFVGKVAQTNMQKFEVLWAGFCLGMSVRWVQFMKKKKKKIVNFIDWEVVCGLILFSLDFYT